MNSKHFNRIYRKSLNGHLNLEKKQIIKELINLFKFNLKERV